MTENPFDFPSNQELLDAITALAANPTEPSWQAYYEILLKCSLILAQDPEEGARPILLVGDNDEVIIPVFTDLARLQRTYPDIVGYSAMPISDLCNVALQNGISMVNINPEQGPGAYLQRDEMMALAMGKMPDFKVGDRSSWNDPNFVPMGDSKIPTQEVLENIVSTASAILETQKGVEAAYIILMGSGDSESQLSIALHFNDNATHQEKVNLSEHLVPSVETVANRPMGIAWLEGEQLEAVRSRVEPFYTRDSS